MLKKTFLFACLLGFLTSMAIGCSEKVKGPPEKVEVKEGKKEMPTAENMAPTMEYDGGQ